MVGAGADRARRGERRRRRDLGRRGDSTRDLEGPWAWCGWSFDWDAPPWRARPLLPCDGRDRATTQPLEPEWNLGGYENNAVQRVPVLVR